MNDSFQTDIMRGMYDEGLEWLVYQSIKIYVESRREAFVKESHKQAMLNEHNSKSDPLRTAVEYLFIEEYDVNIPVNEVNREIKKWFRYAIRSGKVFKEHKSPSTRQINGAMGRAGYFQNTRKIKHYDGDGEVAKVTTERVYEDIKLNPDWEVAYENSKKGEQSLT